jgi:ABC-2 type transport system permease protein
MMRLVEIEWLKLKHYRIFWILLAMYFLGVGIVCSSGMFLMEYLKNQGAEFEGIDPTLLPLYDFPDIWQNVTYIATFFKVFLAFIVVISVTNEISYRTLRQNVIDGLSKREFLLSKIALILLIAAAATLFLFLQGLVTGLIYSHVVEPRFIFSKMVFLPAYFLEVVTYLSFAFLLALLLRRSGFVIVLLFMYTLIFEPFLTLNLEHNDLLPDYLRPLAQFFPVRSLNNLIKVPFQRYVFMEVQDYIAPAAAAIVMVWLIVYNLLIIGLLRIRDI